MTQGGVVPFISPSTLFLRGMAAQCPSLHATIMLVKKQDMHVRARCERLLEAMVRRMPYLPRIGARTTITALAEADKHQIERMIDAERGKNTNSFSYDMWCDFWQDTDEDMRAFCMRCSVLLTEILRSAADAARATAVGA